jgi:hypothetical protein
MYVEVSRQHESFSRANAWKTFTRLNMELIRHPVGTLWAGRIYKVLSEKHLEEVAATLRNFISTPQPGQTFWKLDVPGVLSVGIATPNGTEALKDWAAQIGVEPGQFEGPSDETNELHRLALKIRTEQQQLPLDHAGLIIIDTDMLPAEREHVAWLANILEEAIHDYGQLLGVVLHGTYQGSYEDLVYEMSPHFFLQYGDVPFMVSQQLFINNKYCTHAISEAVASRIRTALATRCVPDAAVLGGLSQP